VTDQLILEILNSTRTIATVGLSSNPAKDSHEVAAYLQSQGYRVIPVNPSAGMILGEKAYPDLASIPFPVDLVQVFRPSDETPAIAHQAVAIGAKTLWLQLGISSDEAKRIGERGGLKVVMDRCLRVEHMRLIANRRR
jgi:predicted CoA-binding protein